MVNQKRETIKLNPTVFKLRYFADQKLVTLFSCADYVGEFDNTAAASRQCGLCVTTYHLKKTTINPYL